ncbi:MAG TPA: hypothetical protein VGA88_10025 [Burkholderiales bacterium]
MREFPAASRAVTVSTLTPDCSATVKLQFTLAELKFWLPLPPALLFQETRVTPTSSVALPPSVMVPLAVERDEALVGAVMLTAGAVVSEPPTGGGVDGVVGTVPPDPEETPGPPQATNMTVKPKATRAPGSEHRTGC